MPVNRFDQPIGQKYTSSYVPLPLDEIGQMAKQYSADYKAGKQAPHALDQLDQALKHAPIHEAKKRALMDKYHAQMNDIVGQARPEDYAKPEYQQKISNLINNFKNDPEVNQIMNTKAWWDKEYIPYINDPDKSNKALIYDVHETSPGVYAQTQKEVSRLKATPYDDREKAAWDIVGDISKSGNLTESGYDFSKGMRVGPGGEHIVYNKYTNKWEGVTKDKLDAVVGHSIKSYGDTKAGKHHIQELLLNEGFGDEAYNYDYNKIQTLASKDDKYKPLLKYVDDKISKHLTDVGFKQVGIVTEKHIDNMTLKDDAVARANEAQEQVVAGNPIESRTFNVSMFDKDPTGKKLLDEGTIENKNGVLQINKDKLLETLKLYKNYDYDKGSVNVQVGEKQSFDKVKELSNFVFKIGIQLGYKPKDIKYDNFEKIINDYNAGSKIRMADEQMADPIREVETKKLENNWNNYDFFNTDDPNVPVDKPVIEKGDKVTLNNFRNIIKGGKAEMYRDGFIKKANGDIVPIMTKPASIIDDKYHDVLSDINLKYIQADLNQKKPKSIAADKSEVIEEDVPISNRGTVDILRTKDQNNNKITVFKYKPKDGGTPTVFYNQADFQQAMLQEYYKTRVGKSETLTIGSKKTRFDSINTDESVDNN